MKRKKKRAPTRSKRPADVAPGAAPVGEARRGEPGSPVLSGGDVDADWRGAEGTGEETVGGTAPTPDQDVVDELGRAVGVEQGATEEVRTSDEILRDRDQRRWQLDWEATQKRDREGRSA